MTFDELIDEINKLTPADRAKQAVVYPPEACPSTALVPVVDVDKTLAGVPVIRTGKTPLESQ